MGLGTVEQRTLLRGTLRNRERRPLEDRFAVRFPGLARRVAAWLTPLTLRMPRHWRLRRLLVEWAAWRVNNAFWRGDLQLLQILWHPDCIWDQSHFEGWPGDQGDAWAKGGGWPDAPSWEEFEGGVFLADQRLRGVGRASGAAVEVDFAQVAQLRDGLFWRCENFTDRAQAVEAARARSSQAT